MVSEGVATLSVTLNPKLSALHHVQAIGIGPSGQPRNLAQTITIAAPRVLASTSVVTCPFLLLALELIAAGVALLKMQYRGGRRAGPAHR